MKRVGVLLLVILLFLPVFAACAGPHDAIYDDPAAIAGEDVYDVDMFLGKQTRPNLFEFSVSSYSGARTVWSYTIREGVDITVDGDLSETKGGDIKLVLIEPDGTVVNIVEARKGQQQASYSFTTQAGEYSIKVVGRGNAKSGAVLQIEGAAGAFAT